MKVIKLIAIIIVAFFSFSCNGSNTVDNNPDDSIVYEMLSAGDSAILFVTKACINDSVYGEFILDTGYNSEKMIFDSTFFYNHVDTTNLVRVKPKYKQFYWQAFYEGEVNIRIADHSFKVTKIEVTNRYRDNYMGIGLIGAGAFLNKMTIIDFDKNRIAFVDTLRIDSSYTAIPLYPPRERHKDNGTQKFVEIDGFVDNKGEKQQGRFLFDTGSWVTGLRLKMDFEKSLGLPLENAVIKKNDLMWRIDSLFIDSIQINKVPVRRTHKPQRFDRYDALAGGDGLLGMPLIKRFNIILDYKNDILYLKPNKWFPLKN